MTDKKSSKKNTQAKGKSSPVKNISVFDNVLKYIGLVSIAFFLLVPSSCKVAAPARSSFGGPVVIDPSKVEKGYTLIAPFRTLTEEPTGAAVQLVDLFGKPVKEWKLSAGAKAAHLKKNGNLVVSLVDQSIDFLSPIHALTSTIEEINWDGKIVWQYRNTFMHHDFEVLPNGNIAVSVLEEVPASIAKLVKGGVEGTEINGIMWSDAILEIDSKGNVVWSWHFFDHLDPERDVLTPLDSRSEWTHVNSIKFIPKNFVSNDEAYLVSARELSTIFLIRKRDGEIIWRSSPDLNISHQHDVSYLENGNILLFDNGVYRKPAPLVLIGSRVLEIDPRRNKIVWHFDGGRREAKDKFTSQIMSGAQRLKNGNTLIVEGARGHIFEVTKEKKIVWDLMAPAITGLDGQFSEDSLFLAKKYSASDVDFPSKLSSPMPMTALACQGVRSFW